MWLDDQSPWTSPGSMTPGQTYLIKVEERINVGAASIGCLSFFGIVGGFTHGDWKLAGDDRLLPPERCKINSNESKCCFSPLSSIQQVLSLIATPGDLTQVKC